MAIDPLNVVREFKLKSGKTGKMYSLAALEEKGFGKVSRLPPRRSPPQKQVCPNASPPTW